MTITQETKPEIKLVGISVRTSNASEMNPETAKIGTTMHRFFGGGIASRIEARKSPDTVMAVYTDYESDEHGAYTYFLGEEVLDFYHVDDNLETLTIPAQTYAKFTSEPGPMPAVCIDLWQKIWTMNAADLGGKRAYLADFEFYDARSHNPEHAVLDILIGLQTA